MGLFTRLYYLVKPYTNAKERRVALFFGGLTERSSLASTRTQLIELLQQNIAVINLWSEYKYKGYTYLTKRERKKLYTNLGVITFEFDRFWQSYHSPEGDERRRLLNAIMEYCSGPRGVYQYRASSSFGRLLVNPREGPLVGDCNQIVTLYIYLYSRYFTVNDLRLRLLPGHVALHYNGDDIEATTGTIAHYGHEKNNTLMPIEEIVSINLLDTTDEYLATHSIAPKDFLQSARFASVLSHDREIVNRNLEAAYITITKQRMDSHNYAQALAFAKQSRDVELLAAVGHNGALYFMDRHQFATARQYAGYALKRADLIHDSYEAEGAYYYNRKKFTEALKAFETAGNRQAVAKCYEGLFFAAQDTLPKQLTSENVRNYRKQIARMRDYAKRSGNKELVTHVDRLRQYL